MIEQCMLSLESGLSFYDFRWTSVLKDDLFADSNREFWDFVSKSHSDCTTPHEKVTLFKNSRKIES